LQRALRAAPRRAACGRGNGVKIRTIEPIAVSLPMKKPVKMAGDTSADFALSK